MTSKDNTDKRRLSQMWKALKYLGFAFYYTNEAKYAEKAIELLKIWFLNPQTKVYPNVNFGQGIPGKTDGRPFGIIEWTGIAQLVTTLQILKSRNVLDEKFEKDMKQWLNSFLDWLLHSELGKMEGTRENNHANWYDYQVVGLSIYLGRIEEAKQRTETAKRNRIETQIEPDGSQPYEMTRTKSLSYCTMNLKAMILVGALAESIDVDLLHFSTKEGRSLLKAADFLKPYVMGEKDWPHQQITSSGWQGVVEEQLIPLFSIMSSIYRKRLLPQGINMEEKIKLF